jgi:hypothetical protein
VTLRRLDLAEEIYHLNEPQKAPVVMSVNEVKRLLAVARPLKAKGGPLKRRKQRTSVQRSAAKPRPKQLAKRRQRRLSCKQNQNGRHQQARQNGQNRHQNRAKQLLSTIRIHNQWSVISGQ